MCARYRRATAHLGNGRGCRSHVFPVDENVHGVVGAPLHAHTVPDLSAKHMSLANVLAPLQLTPPLKYTSTLKRVGTGLQLS